MQIALLALYISTGASRCIELCKIDFFSGDSHSCRIIAKDYTKSNCKRDILVGDDTLPTEHVSLNFDGDFTSEYNNAYHELYVIKD